MKIFSQIPPFENRIYFRLRSLIRIIQEARLGEIYNLSEQSKVKVSLETREYTANTDAVEPLLILDPAYFRPTEVDTLIGNATKAREKLDRQSKTSVTQLEKS
jgi:GDP-D-mannose dehydratase